MSNCIHSCSNTLNVLYETTTIHTSSWRSFSLIKKTADRINERVTAVGAGVGLLAAVDAQVLLQRRVGAERLLAAVARVRPTARVRVQVHLTDKDQSERLANQQRQLQGKAKTQRNETQTSTNRKTQ